jgi:DNA processing protein
VLVGLAECVVVIQASLKSGSRNAARKAREFGRPVYVVPGMPGAFQFEGSMAEGAKGAQAFWSIEWFFEKLGLPPPDLDDRGASWRGRMPLRAPPSRRPARAQPYSPPPIFPVDEATWTPEEKAVFSALSKAPTHQDTLVQRTGLPTSSTVTALLTLSLKDVVVEGPDGFFRRRVDI